MTKIKLPVILLLMAGLLAFAACKGNPGKTDQQKEPVTGDVLEQEEKDPIPEKQPENNGDSTTGHPDAGPGGYDPDDELPDYIGPELEPPDTDDSGESGDGADAGVPGDTTADPEQNPGNDGEQASDNPTVEVPEPVLWTDPVIESLVRAELDRAEGDIYPEDLLQIRSLVLEAAPEEELNISITDLEGMTNLQFLVLRSVSLTDLTPLAGLTALEDLDLGDNRITDISGLTGLTGLKSLYLDGNGIQDVSALAGLTELEVLVLDDNLIEDVVPLRSLVKLNGLYLADNYIEDISMLDPLVELEELDLSGNSVGDYSVTSYFSKLEKLILE